ncbi:hypothetical protein DACRYDRAFT_48857, partial [Dacryopinax primogenitus]
TEVTSQAIEMMLCTYVDNCPQAWACWLGLVNHAYNSSAHASTGYSPYFLLYGFQPAGP